MVLGSRHFRENRWSDLHNKRTYLTHQQELQQTAAFFTQIRQVRFTDFTAQIVMTQFCELVPPYTYSRSVHFHLSRRLDFRRTVFLC